MFILSIFEMFGLEMHIGKGDAPSKTEYVFFPQPDFFFRQKQYNAKTQTPIVYIAHRNKKNDALRLEQMDKWKQYDNSDKINKMRMKMDFSTSQNT